jgi:hypothetical protein
MATAINPAEKNLIGVIERLLWASASARTFALAAEFTRCALVMTNLAAFYSGSAGLAGPKSNVCDGS